MTITDSSAITSSLDTLIGERLDACTQQDLPMLVGEILCQIVDRRLDRLPLPGDGATLARWQVLAAVAARDLCLFKLFEAHTDALSILAQAGMAQTSQVTDMQPFSIWGVWCAEPPGAGLTARPVATEGRLLLDGEKPWCSGAALATHALLSYRDEHGQSCLAAVDLDQPGVVIEEDGWKAVGMAATRTATVKLSAVLATPVGGAGFYLQRPGFWHGAIGIAAGWHGAAVALGTHLRQSLARRHDAHALAHLGQVECHLAASADSLRQAACLVDEHPAADAFRLALRCRLQVEHAAHAVIDHVGRALGPAPYCRHRHSARLLADLPVFLRQSHAERDLEQLGTLCMQQQETPWPL